MVVAVAVTVLVVIRRVVKVVDDVESALVVMVIVGVTSRTDVAGAIPSHSLQKVATRSSGLLSRSSCHRSLEQSSGTPVESWRLSRWPSGAAPRRASLYTSWAALFDLRTTKAPTELENERTTAKACSEGVNCMTEHSRE